MTSLEQLLDNHRIIVCAGSGGVGKTTMSASLGVLAAERGKRVLVMTIDPAKRLATALGLENLPGQPTLVPDQNFKGQLWAAVVDSKSVFDEFVARYLDNHEDREKILANRLYQQLSTTLSGSQEYTALERLYQAYEDKRFDLVILDTPPSQHAIDFLRAPQKVYALFQSGIVKWFLPASGTHATGIRGFFDRGTKSVFKVLENLTGAAFVEELRGFFYAIRSFREIIQEHSAEIHRILTGQDTTFVLVTSFDEVKISEARVFQKALMATGYNLSTVIINRAFPLWMAKNNNDFAISSNRTIQKLKDYYQGLILYYTKHQEAFDQFERDVRRELEVLRIPDFDQDIHDLEGLGRVAAEIKLRSQKEVNA